MRRLRRLSVISLGLLSVALGGEALAAPGLVTRTGRFAESSLVAGKRASASALETAAQRLLHAQIPASTAATLGRATTSELASGTRVVKLPQLHQGVPVLHRGVAVTFGADDVAEIISAHLEDNLPASVIPQISAIDAANAASQAAGIGIEPARAGLAIFPTADGPRLVWAMSAPLIASLVYQPVVIVDATSGEIVLKYNAITTLNQATTYASNPTKSPSLINVTLPVAAGETTLQNAGVKSLNCIDTKKTKTISIMGFNLDVHACELLQTAKPSGSGDYLSVIPAEDTAPEDSFSELSMFYHVNRAYDFFRAQKPDLKVDPNAIPTVSNLRVPQGFDTFDLNKIKDPNLPLAPFQNAFFSPSNPIFDNVFGISGGAMFFGQGPLRDYSYDGDVIYHEFTHAVVNVTLKLVGNPHLDKYGVSYSPGAMNEGLADFFSSALTGDPDVGEYASKDIDPKLAAIRSLSSPDACPADIGGEVHQDATMFSGSLWDARKALTGTQQGQFDAAIFAAMNSSPTGDLGYEDFALLATKAVESSPLGKPVADGLTAAFTARGLLPHCERLLESTGKPLAGPKALQGIWFAPGTQTTGVKAPTGAYTPGVIQFHQKLADNTTGLTVEFKDVNIGGGGGGVPGGGGTPFTPKLIVRFASDPITFTYGPLKPPADAILVDAKKGTSTYSASVKVPPGATSVYVMVGSTGQTDGAYTALTITAEAPAATGAGGASGAGGADAVAVGVGGAGGSEVKNNPGPTEIGGCGCSVPGQDTSAAGALAALATLAGAGIFSARRKRRA